MTFLAGTEAERVFLGSARGNSDHDRACAVDLAMYASGDEAETSAYLDWLRCRTRNLLANGLMRLHVEALAAALLEHGHLSGRQVRAVCDEAIRGHVARAVTIL